MGSVQLTKSKLKIKNAIPKDKDMQKVSGKILLTKDPDNFKYVYFFLKENFG